MRVFILLLLTTVCTAAIVERTIETEFEGTTFRSTLVFEDASDHPKPGVLMVPNWMGPATEGSLEKAKRIAGYGYVVLLADVYGIDTRPENAEEAGEAAGALRSDRPQLRSRARHQLENLRDVGDAPLDSERIAAIGFCFGGGTVLELARSGASLDGVVSFHGNLDTPDTGLAADIVTPIMVLHGADDPYVPQEQVMAFIKEMKDAPVDVHFVQLHGAVHSFTNPQADQEGKAHYDQRAAQRAFRLMNDFFAEIFILPGPP